MCNIANDEKGMAANQIIGQRAPLEPSPNIRVESRYPYKEKVMPKENLKVTLYLAGWQKRMIKDFIGVSEIKVRNIEKLTKIIISIIDKKQWVMYRQPIEAIKAREWNLYLTDEQINIVAANTGLRTKISALNVSPEMVKSGAIVFQ
jgi:hypothetical protein